MIHPHSAVSKSIVACLCFAAAAAAQDGARGPEPFELPDGLEATLWAQTPALYNPTSIDVDARGRVWVAEAVNYRRWDGRNPGFHYPSGEGDRIVILEDTNGSGTCTSSKTFVQEKALTAPLGVCVLGNRVLVSCSPNAIEYVDSDGDDAPDKRSIFLTGFGGFDHDHGLHSFIPGPDGSLYFAAGNAGPHIVTDAAGFHLRSGSVYNGGGPTAADNKPGMRSDDGGVWVGGLAMRIGEDARGLSVLAHNFRNNYELALDSFGNVYQNDNDDDGNQGCRTAWLLPGGNYGYFSADGSRYWNDDRRPQQDVFRAHWHQDDPGVMPAGCRNGAGGPTGVAFYDGDLMPALRGAVLDCDAGRGIVYMHRPRVHGAGRDLEHGVLLQLAKGARDQDAPWNAQFGQRHLSWFRPSDVAVAPDGSLFVADWYDPGVGGHAAGDRDCYGRIFRIAPKGNKWSVPKIDVSTPEGACAALRSPALSVRYIAWHALAAMGERALPALRTMARDADARHAARAAFLVVRLEKDPSTALAALLGAADPELRLVALRAAEAAGRDTMHILETLCADASPLVRAEAAARLRTLPAEKKLPWIARLAAKLDPSDRFEIEAIGLAAAGCESAAYDACAAALPKADAVLRALRWRLHPASAIPLLAADASHTSIPEAERARAVDAIAFIPAREAADAMIGLALTGPDALRPAARWWLRHRAGNDWREFGVTAPGAADRSRAKRIWSSGLMTRGVKEVEVDLAGATALFLEVTDGGNGNSHDWADWIEPRLVGPKGELRLIDLPWNDAHADWGETRINKSAAGGALLVDGAKLAWGVGTHANSQISYSLPEGYNKLIAKCAPDDGGTKQSKNAPTSIEFEVWTETPPDRAPLVALEKTVADKSAPHDARAEAAAKLAADPEGARYLLLQAEKHQIDESLLPDIEPALATNPDLAVRALASRMFPKRAAGGATLPPIDALAAMDGDAARGRAVFISKEAQCMQCHRFRGRGGDIGPDLTAIRQKYNKAALLDAVLNPSAGIAFGYDTWLIATKDGRTYTGFILADGEQLALKDTQGKRCVIEASQIEERIKQKISAMPEGLALGMTAQQLVDLAAFLSEDPDAPPVFGAERDLFNGRDWTGWTHHLSDPKAKRDDVWSIADGVITCKGSPAGYIRTTDDFTNYRLTVEWRFDPAKPGNSGVLLRMHGADKVWPKSIEAQLLDRNAGDIWNIDEFPMLVDASRTDGRRTAKLAPCSEKPYGEWNRYVITMRHGDLRLEVNGVLQNSASWCEEIAGKICLQSEGAEIQFRNIKITPILN